MLSTEEEIKAWKTLLENGQISEETYYKEVGKIERRILYEPQPSPINGIGSFIKIIFLLVFGLIAIIILNSMRVDKPIEKVKSLKNLYEPIQAYTNGSALKIIDGKEINIRYIASYSISGKVVDVQKYSGYKTQNKLSPIDLGIAWGVVADNSEKITWSSHGTRFLSWRTNDMNWYNDVGGEKVVNQNCSNNHIIPSDKNIEKLIKSIKIDDYIKLEGYLVSLRCDEEDGKYFTWSSSTNRNDDGNGACELIYVTDVKWLEEE